MMTVKRYFPSDILKPYIKSYTVIESGLHELTNRILPSTSLSLAFRLRGRTSYLEREINTLLPATVFTGLKSSARLVNYGPLSSCIIVIFQETVVPTFCKQPRDLFNQSISLDHFFSSQEILDVEEKLGASADHSECISVIEKLLYPKLATVEQDLLVTEAIRQIKIHKGNLRMRTLATSLWISQDAFEKRFRNATGATPKQFSFIVKMSSIVQQRATPLLDHTFDNGYYDQSHFTKDFIRFTGQTPTEFFQSARAW